MVSWTSPCVFTGGWPSSLGVVDRSPGQTALFRSILNRTGIVSGRGDEGDLNPTSNASPVPCSPHLSLPFQLCGLPFLSYEKGYPGNRVMVEGLGVLFWGEKNFSEPFKGKERTVRRVVSRSVGIWKKYPRNVKTSRDRRVYKRPNLSHTPPYMKATQFILLRPEYLCIRLELDMKSSPGDWVVPPDFLFRRRDRSVLRRGSGTGTGPDWCLEGNGKDGT